MAPSARRWPGLAPAVADRSDTQLSFAEEIDFSV
jgi:hypothetical protein